jgi:hypothetical protein
MKNQIGTILGFIILTATLAAVSCFGINKFYGLRIAEINSEFDFQCAQTYRYTETLKNGAIVSYPMVKEYKDCANSKEKLH